MSSRRRRPTTRAAAPAGTATRRPTTTGTTGSRTEGRGGRPAGSGTAPSAECRTPLKGTPVHRDARDRTEVDVLEAPRLAAAPRGVLCPPAMTAGPQDLIRNFA